MPTLLRLALGGVLLVFMMLSALVPAVFGPGTDGVRFAIWTFALTLIAMPALLGALYLSYWSWSDEDARRRRRRLFAVLAVIQVLGAVLLLAAAASAPRWFLGTTVVVVVGLALDPAMLAIGRAARRIEERRPQPVAPIAPAVDREIRTGWRRGGIGAAIGLAVGLVLLAGLSLLLKPGDSVIAVSTVAIVVSLALLGASLGMITKSLQLSRRIRHELGGDYSTARRIGRAVAGKPGLLGPDDERAAARYAAIAVRWKPFQLTASLLVLVAIAVQQVGSLSDDGRLDPVRWFSIGILVVAVLVATPMAVVRVRRLRRYAAAHPVPAV